MMNIGLFGAGNIGNTHARAIQSIADAKIVAVFDSNREKAMQLGAACDAGVYTDQEQFLSQRPMDMVIVATPSGLHAQQGIAAANQRLHVLVEKPIDIRTERADALIRACDESGVRCGVVFQERYAPGTLQLKNLISQGALGRLLLVSAHVPWYRPPEYYTESSWHGVKAIDGGGALINQGIHTLDLLLWLVGDVTNIQAATATLLQPTKSEDTALALLEFANGAFGTIEITTVAYPGYERHIEIRGTEGTVILEAERIVKADLRSKTDCVVSDVGGLVGDRAKSWMVADISGHRSVIEAFIGAIRSGNPFACDGREGRRSLELVERIYAAANEFRKNNSRQ